MEFKGHTLHRIKALIDFSGFTKGTLGGWIESEDNLSHEGGCWIHDESKVFGNARVRKSAQIIENSIICEGAVISGAVVVRENSRVSGDAYICENANIYGGSIVSGHPIIGNNSRIINSIVSCEFLDYRGLSICLDDAKILDSSDYISFTGFGSINRTTYMFRGQDGRIKVKCGCFRGKLFKLPEYTNILFSCSRVDELSISLSPAVMSWSMYGQIADEVIMSSTTMYNRLRSDGLSKITIIEPDEKGK